MVLCFDIGGTSIKYGAAYEENGNIVFAERSEIPTNAKEAGGPGIAACVERLINEMKERYDAEGIAISTAGMVDFETGTIIYANENIPDYIGWDWKTFIREKFDLPCSVENDVNCAALGESIYGAGRGADSVLCITVGTGVGGAVILDRRIWHGHNGCAGEIGYMKVNGVTLEKSASTTALIKNVEEKTGKKLNGKQIFDLAKAGDEDCRKAIDELCAALAKGIACISCLFDAETVVLGGGIMAQKEYLAPLIRSHLDRCVDSIISDNCNITFASLGNTAGMAGAFYICAHPDK